jgi:hypothetical protein
MLICSVASVELRSLDRDDDQVRFLDGVADDQVLGTLEIDDDEPALRAGLVDPVDQGVGVRVDDGEALRNAGPRRPAQDGLVRIGVDDGDAFALIGQDRRNENAGCRFSRPALRRAHGDDRHGKPFRKPSASGSSLGREPLPNRK